ncbi:hypothetical protein HDE_04270 [Halotydeus destructor]|nr:hypothetical protein HDE_04270 [Halotydeus destructor]
MGALKGSVFLVIRSSNIKRTDVDGNMWSLYSYKRSLLKVSDRPYEGLEGVLLRGYIIPTSLAEVRSRSMTWKQYLKVDLMTVVLLIATARDYGIVFTTDEQHQRLLGNVLSSFGIQGKCFIFTLTFYYLMSIGLKVIPRHLGNIEHMLDMIPLVQGGDDRLLARKMRLTISHLAALKVRIKMANMAVTVACFNFPLAMAFAFGMGLFITLPHEPQVGFMVNYIFWVIANIYLVYVMSCAAPGTYFCWYIGAQWVKLRLRQVNDSLKAILADELDLDQLDAILAEQRRIVSKIHRYNMLFKNYIMLVVFICSPMFGLVLFVTFFVEFELQLIKIGIIIITCTSVCIIWFTSFKTADVHVEVRLSSLNGDFLLNIYPEQAKMSAPLFHSILAKKRDGLTFKLITKMAASLEMVVCDETPIAFSCGSLFPWLPMTFYDVRNVVNSNVQY